MNFETTVGLEVHIEMQTKSKAYSPSPVQYGAEQNTNTNVIDWGYPGVLPVVNKGALEFAMRAALALNCEIEQDIHYDRKNYFYPDNPKAYQITQFQTPIGHDGWVEIDLEDGSTKKVRIHEIHMEEDAGKNSHKDDGYSYVDLNRQGTPLVEIVAEPDLSSPEEAVAYLTKLRQIIQFTGISDVKMEEGSMRADVNVSVRPYGADKLGVRTEMKNLNSFEHVRKGIQYESKRQQGVLLTGGEIQQETRRFDDVTGTTSLLRSKEEANDYRYFPEPDIPPIHISEEWIEKVRGEIPEMPDKRRARYVNEWGIPEYDAGVLTQTKEMSDFYDATVNAGADAKLAANWLMGEVNAYMNAQKMALDETALTPEHLATMIKLIVDGTISSKIAKKVFKEIITNDTDPQAWVEEKGMVQLSDPAKLQPIIDEILDNNEQSIEDFKNGKDRAVGFLVGQIMKQTRGMANPKMVNKLLMASLNQR
ncbi:Asp-tRNA(Asn)/Glu-tRNA(Gln) amidotransferase subunit GatB [Ligilactobacillus ceti]|uniref:Aspartyl/glutamyl-tRNA(Asn/Gln) amidotransferase subunit B n=1 Tax=Ligilactobacillus ceti DSM 22408 TaxID=1122146 RepID=A0A0R2KM81_9LACO|nr:Asp-tRNA(Asn)/Glu-tRNA(Gln) amidotransferase subunit GatB [Ligilactobacillus ceti]KRN90553.1 GatB GatE catalytic domain protein [Ligilactobacillus ceti DSM 22408]